MFFNRNEKRIEALERKVSDLSCKLFAVDNYTEVIDERLERVESRLKGGMHVAGKRNKNKEGMAYPMTKIQLNKLMTVFGMSPSELARSIDVSDKELCGWLNGNTAVDTVFAKKVDRLFISAEIIDSKKKPEDKEPIEKKKKKRPNRKEQEMLQEIVKEYGLNGATIARILGTFNQSVYAWINGKHRPSKKFRKGIKRLLSELRNGDKVKEDKPCWASDFGPAGL